MKICRLNTKGIADFAAWLEALRKDPGLVPPLHLLTDESTSVQLGKVIHLEAQVFPSRFKAAEYLFDALANENLVNVVGDTGLWAWLSLFFIDTVCPPSAHGIRKPGALARYIPESSNFKRYYRHLLAGPYRIYRAHRDDPQRAMALLCKPVDAPGEVAEQLSAYQQIVTNRGLIELATKLYFSSDTQNLKRGASGKGGGSARRLPHILEQFELTWDLYSATPEELASIMPSEFAKFLAK